MDNYIDSKDQSSQETEKNVNKVIRLNSPGTRRVQMKMDINAKKSALTASILSIIAAVTFLNQKILSQFETQSSGRSIASVDDQSQYGYEWQKDLAKKLSDKSNRGIASLGEAPSKLDQIRFGLLEGKYSLRFDNKYIAEIQFSVKETEDRPKYIPNFEEFLKENKDVLIPDLSEVKVVENTVEGDYKKQLLEVFGIENKPLGKVTYTSDLNGRFLSMKFVPN